jgi:hypothetical protein
MRAGLAALQDDLGVGAADEAAAAAAAGRGEQVRGCFASVACSNACRRTCHGMAEVAQLPS